jgi:hypothetical protein
MMGSLCRLRARMRADDASSITLSIHTLLPQLRRCVADAPQREPWAALRPAGERMVAKMHHAHYVHIPFTCQRMTERRSLSRRD